VPEMTGEAVTKLKAKMAAALARILKICIFAEDGK